MKPARRSQLVVALVLAGAVGSACTAPVYHHAFTTKYDKDMNVVGYEEVESITQQDPNPTPLKVRIDNKKEIED